MDFSIRDYDAYLYMIEHGFDHINNKIHEIFDKLKNINIIDKNATINNTNLYTPIVINNEKWLTIDYTINTKKHQYIMPLRYLMLPSSSLDIILEKKNCLIKQNGV